jgi:hypothetical protein
MLECDLDRLRKRLIRRGMSVRHASRMVRELGAHAEDIADELSASGSPADALENQVRKRLGDFDLLAEEIDECFTRRTFWGRHPVATFVLLPILSFSLLILVPIWAGSLLVSFLDEMAGYGVTYDLNATLAFCRLSFEYYGYIFAFASAGWFVCLLRRYVCNMKWSAVAAGTLAVLQYLLVSTINVGPPVAAGKYLSGSFTLGLALTDPPTPDRLVRVFMPLALFFLMCGRNIWYGRIRAQGENR